MVGLAYDTAYATIQCLLSFVDRHDHANQRIRQLHFTRHRDTFDLIRFNRLTARMMIRVAKTLPL